MEATGAPAQLVNGKDTVYSKCKVGICKTTDDENCIEVILFDLILYVLSTIFQLNRDGFSWVEPVLSLDKCVLLKGIEVIVMHRGNSHGCFCVVGQLVHLVIVMMSHRSR